MRAKASACLLAAMIGVSLLPAALVRAQSTAPANTQQGATVPRTASPPPNAVRRQGTRLRVYGRSGYLPPTAVRACEAWYEQEYRPSGTVIVPRMRCRWVNG